jgi:ADP-ribose diphosphatase
MPEKPIILKQTTVAQSRLFTVQEIHLRFSNGAERIFERLNPHSKGAVLVVAMKDANTFLLVNEYSAGLDKYELAFPKGIVEPNETLIEAANRELREEIGFSAAKITELHALSLAPGYMSHKTHILLAEGLTPDRLEGDEPEPLEIVPWSFDNLDELLEHEDFTEARSFAALWLVKRHLSNREKA